MLQIILAQMRWQQPALEGGLATTLSADQRRHTFIAVKRVHLQPMGHCRAQPDGKIRRLLGADAGQSAKETSHMVLSVPLGQVVEVVADGVVRAYLF